jgi:hypothetical protein
MAWPRRVLRDWSEFDEFCGRTSQRGHPFGSAILFRGQPDENWELAPSLLRHLGTLSIGQAREIERDALRTFINEASIYSGSHSDVVWPMQGGSLVDWWVIMQHYGAPTRLLDWTRSPYVAAYFAVEQQPEKAGVVFAFPPFQLNLFINSEFPNVDWISEAVLTDVNAPLMLRPHAGERMCSPRMVAQQGHFTVCTNLMAKHGELIEAAMNSKVVTAALAQRGGDIDDLFTCLVIPPKLKPQFRRHLHLMNVTASTLFPGVDGLGLSIAERIALTVDSIHSKAQS